MKCSVVIAVYNGMEFLHEQLESIKNQSRKPDEVLLIDDCSSDNSITIINNYIKKYKLNNWKLLINKENKGWRYNFFKGITISSGELIFPCDQDDIWCLDKIEIMENIMKYNHSIQLLSSNYCMFYENGKKKIAPEKENLQLIQYNILDNIFNIKYPGCTYCIRKSFVKKAIPYWKKTFPHDAFFWRLAVVSNSAFVINKSLIYWRRHNKSSYTIESNNRTFETQLAWLNYANEVISTLEIFIEDNRLNINKSLIVRNKNWNKLRTDYYNTRKLLYWIQLFRYIDLYPSKKQIFTDFIIVNNIHFITKIYNFIKH